MEQASSRKKKIIFKGFLFLLQHFPTEYFQKGSLLLFFQKIVIPFDDFLSLFEPSKILYFIAFSWKVKHSNFLHSFKFSSINFARLYFWTKIFFSFLTLSDWARRRQGGGEVVTGKPLIKSRIRFMTAII